ncbi:hypothetical protein JCM19039_2428 [Geomicrobium sp. JCM 19039]|nr:hypothetical protein JCM19039_2428 [Geomicrobium sp. JCM 19039]
MEAVLELDEISGKAVYSHKLGNRMSKLGNRLSGHVHIPAPKYPQAVGAVRAEPRPIYLRQRSGR